MKNVILAILTCFTILTGAKGQGNTSYDSNAVAIGGLYNCAFGIGTLKLNLGTYNTGVGYNALFSNINGGYNSAIGYNTLFSNSTGNFNTAIGYNALYSNTTGRSNTANGSFALSSNTQGFDNTAFGQQSLRLNTTGFQNTATGYRALFLNTEGYANTATGEEALANNITGIWNVANGSNALGYNTIGNWNIGIGGSALLNNSIGNNNIAIGDSSGFNNKGDANLYLGKRAGFYETGSNKLYVGIDSNKTIIYGDMASGQLLLGNKQPFGYNFKGKRTLNVLGGILTDSIRIGPSSGWADYVFSKDYQLKPLLDLENFIRTNKHLPNIPSAMDVSVNGIELLSITTKLLEKIEELTLYILQQQKQIVSQQNTNDMLKLQSQVQQKDLDLLKKAVEEIKLSKE